MILGAPAGSTERHERRTAALRMCVDIIERGGCVNTEPYELALRLMEVEEEVASHTAAGAHSTAVEPLDARTAATRLPSTGAMQTRVPAADTACHRLMCM